MAEPNQTTAATEPQVTPAQGNQPQTFSAEYVSALRSESKGYRLAAKANEQALRTLLGVADSEELGDLNARISAFQTNAEQAKAEGFTQIAALFEAVGAIEKEHEARYRKLLANIEGDCVFSKDGDVIWECANCGHIVVGQKAPEVCPVCQHPQSYFQVKAENY